MVKVISLSDDAYTKLKSLKRNRSFSEIVVELVEKKQRNNIMDFCGIWSNSGKEVDKMKKMIEKDRDNFKLREVKF